MQRRQWPVGLLLATGLVLAGCGSDTADEPTGGPSSGAATSVPTTRTLDGGAELDDQTTTWFATFCSGVSEFQTALGSMNADTPAEAGQGMAQTGQQLTELGERLADTPPPTFDGGADYAAQTATGFQELGPALTRLGQQAGELDPDDEAAAQAWAAQVDRELTPLASSMQGLDGIDMAPDTEQALLRIPECAALSNAADPRTAPTS
ncbi:hypothetical protein [Nakamurella leprariae]|uniref:Uncharacterized protein n=1 Tax=Nakamurella leprariae TaxID=2803911 RepID=A0A938YIL4_9ACTN|nr:hypothetical protein [Nakamurella leprariae]MBM9468824.1 hypothetical protein [Nakamurella leprariae]